MKRTVPPSSRSKRDPAIGDERVSGTSETRDDRISVPVREVDVKPSTRRVVGGECQPQQAALAAGQNSAGQIQKVGLEHRSASHDSDASALLHNELNGSIGRVLHEGDRPDKSRRVHLALQLRVCGPPGKQKKAAHHARESHAMYRNAGQARVGYHADNASSFRAGTARVRVRCRMRQKRPRDARSRESVWRRTGCSRRSSWMDAAGPRLGRHHVASVRALRRRNPYGAHQRRAARDPATPSRAARYCRP